MPTERFDAVFRGQILPGQNAELVKAQVGKMFNATSSQIEQLFSGYPVVLKRAVDAETAGRLRLAFRQAGALIEIRSNKEIKETKTEVTSTATEWTISAVAGFSLEDCVVTKPTAVIPDIQHLTMATAGTQIDHTLPPPLVNIDTSNLNLIPGQTWTLEDCNPHIRPVTLPNMNNITLDAPGTTLDDSKPPTPVHINTNAISIVTQKNWSLEDCQPPPPPPLKVDLSNLKL
jgi:hypothetical protein